ncbi:hypothetical protein NEUTE1DRAFT_35156 [Neurospora tetrasperma FGSC 2508]|uniref:Uncharacterized protein n=1 Tax=Neurospora tetrasperma (strain FGSC 2508 / ATCC MYA-4615 / P0657) TaxID=510951 RepID=F8MDU9_NEUT8|nr:uncharacterized protein NEUTE1DRAFT_35156 [Neurospora tetrasperma FGSC 2508]EGO60686.1 hypothetical protein NEUTE1DRAFT_35156 [Neurospora tetrasperma FGSC 2508]EGZ75330.1 hypothetical protein NEUTE2DRAFT_56144 [Neurospora tetrasperma FGSC 2509]
MSAAAAGASLPFGALVAIVLLGTFTVSATLAFFGIWLSRRRRLAVVAAGQGQTNKERSGGCHVYDLTGETTIASTALTVHVGNGHDAVDVGDFSPKRSPRKLQKLPSAAWTTASALKYNSTTCLLPKAKGKGIWQGEGAGNGLRGREHEMDGEGEDGVLSVSMLPGMSWMDLGGAQEQGSLLPFSRLRKTSSGSLLRLHKTKLLGVSRKKSSANERRMANSAWIDEEAIHGPEMSGMSNIPDENGTSNDSDNNSHRKSWLFGWRKGKGRDWIRESWPLKTRAPTVPRLDDYQELPRSQMLSQSQNQSQLNDQRAEQLETETMTGRLGIPSTDSGRSAVRSAYGAMEGGGEGLSVSLLLPEPPQPAIVRGQAGTGGGFVVQHRHTKSEPQRILRVTNPSTPTSLARPTPIPTTQSTSTKNRQVSTDSTLSEILRSTEKRLQKASTSGVSRRNRATIQVASGPHRGLSLHVAERLEESRSPGLRRSDSLKETRGTRVEHQLPVISPSSSGLVAPLTLVPKSSGQQQQRPDSRESSSSEPDSLLAEPAYSEMPSGLTSPSRVSSIAGASSVAETEIEMLLLTVDVPSNRSSMTSAASLSTIHSVDESSEGGARVSVGTKTPSPDRAAMVAGTGRPTVSLQTSMVDSERFALPAPLSAVDASAPSLPSGSSARPFTSYGCPVPRPLSTRSQGETESNRRSFVRKSIIAQEPIGPMPSMPTRLLPCPGVPSGKNCVIAQTSCGTWHTTMANPFQVPVSPTSIQASTDSASPTSSSGSMASRETLRGLRSPPNKSTTYNNTLLNSIVLPPPTQHRYVDAKTVVAEIKPPASESSSVYSQDIAANEAFSPAPVPTFTVPTPSSPTRTSLPPSPTTVGLAAAQALNAANFQRNSILFAGSQQQTPSCRTSRTIKPNRASVLAAQRDLDDEVEDDEGNKENTAAMTPKASPIAATIAQLRRMNSVLSTASSVSSINTDVPDGGGNGYPSRRNSRVGVSSSPTQSALRGGGFNPIPRRDSHQSYGHRRSGSRNYLFALSGGAGAVPSTPTTPKVVKRTSGSGGGSGGRVRPNPSGQMNGHLRTGSESGSGIGRMVSISRSGSPKRITLTPGHHRSLGSDYGGSSVIGSSGLINANILKNRFQFDDHDDDDNNNNKGKRASNGNGITKKQNGSDFLVGAKNDEGKEEESKRKLPVRFTLPNSSTATIGLTANSPPSSPSQRSKQVQTGMVYVTPKGKRWRQSNESLGLYDRDGFLINSHGQPPPGASSSSVRA